MWQACVICQKNKCEALMRYHQPLPIPQQVWSKISMDFTTRLPRAKGKDSIMVVVDRLTKYAHYMAFAHPFTAKDLA